MPVCPTCGRWLVRRDLVGADGPPGDDERNRCPVDGSVVDMDAPRPIGGGPLIGLKRTPPPPLSRKEGILGCLAAFGYLYTYLGFLLVIPLLVVAAAVFAGNGNWLLLAVGGVAAVINVALLWALFKDMKNEVLPSSEGGTQAGDDDVHPGRDSDCDRPGAAHR